MKTEKQYFDEAIPLAAYMEKMEKHKENSFGIYEKFEVPQDDEFIEILKQKKPDVLVITEDWCGDAMMNNPILRRIAEAAELDVRTAYRDEDTDLIDRHLTNGGRSIPIYLLLDDEGEVLAKWGPRAATIQEDVLERRKQLPAKEAPEFEEKQRAFITELMKEYTTQPELWLTVYEDIRKTFMPALQKTN
ncbi:thioredoxin family protein [Sporosarcina highlanderae]|uniref:Thioredoxin family protein n=1 Tax=Sporosarcina highlanderae TaxID=3035916 RepID=A0ABT8JT03_9BACL|nr:thioredoxin family protein [Sporosarcina highlanderae]MDN4608301.1 thioredoxin family protein [Sporosarcina highlanderae]